MLLRIHSLFKLSFHFFFFSSHFQFKFFFLVLIFHSLYINFIFGSNISFLTPETSQNFDEKELFNLR